MKNEIELVFILDRSGSMSGLENETIKGFNSMIAKQKKTPTSIRVTTVLFDDKYEVLHDFVNIKDVKKITKDEYFVRGGTAMLDAIGMTLKRMDEAKKHGGFPRAVICVITTDGCENASKEYDYNTIKNMIGDKKHENWQFIFLGANIDSPAEAEKIGISRKFAANYENDIAGVSANYEAINEAITEARINGVVGQNWKKGLK